MQYQQQGYCYGDNNVKKEFIFMCISVCVYLYSLCECAVFLHLVPRVQLHAEAQLLQLRGLVTQESLSAQLPL